MSSVVVLQARTNSSRLPAKVLLPIKQTPVVVLAAMRAANTGRNVIVATSRESSDDGLVSLIEHYGIGCFRGSLDNTLDRMVHALSGYDDQTVVFRLTADNVFPDGALLDEMESEFLARKLDYFCCNGEPSGLPYGVSVEVTRLCHLREAAFGNNSDYDREHVTPYIIRKFGLTYFEKYKNIKKGNFRCTIDCLDDYIGIQKVFSEVADPVAAPLLDLVSRLENLPFQPCSGFSAAKLVFGTVQLGGQYGIANTSGQPDKELCQALIKTAISNGVICLDTARGYGDSEAMIGQSLSRGWGGRAIVITKLSPLNECPPEASMDVVQAFVDASVFQSCAALQTQKLDVLMLHRVVHLSAWNGSVWQRLLDLQAAGVIGKLGASVQNPEELLAALRVPDIEYIQMPCNLLDWRWDAVIPKLLEARRSRELTIHARSSLLQGLLPSEEEKHWLRANVESASGVMDWLKDQVKNCNRLNVADLCLGFVNALEWVDGIAIGMENMHQLIENINYFSRPIMSPVQIDAIRRTRPKLSEATLNPALWRKENA